MNRVITGTSGRFVSEAANGIASGTGDRNFNQLVPRTRALPCGHSNVGPGHVTHSWGKGTMLIHGAKNLPGGR